MFLRIFDIIVGVLSVFYSFSFGLIIFNINSWLILKMFGLKCLEKTLLSWLQSFTFIYCESWDFIFQSVRFSISFMRLKGLKNDRLFFLIGLNFITFAWILFFASLKNFGVILFKNRSSSWIFCNLKSINIIHIWYIRAGLKIFFC